MEKVKGWRTLILSIVIAIIGVLEAFDWAHVVPDSWEPFLLPLAAVLFGWLRTITNTAVGKSE